MKKFLFNILPSFLKNFKHADKIAHAIYGTVFYLLVNLVLSSDLSLFSTFCLAIGIEIYDKYKGGKADVLDALATMIIPTILYVINPF